MVGLRPSLGPSSRSDAARRETGGRATPGADRVPQPRSLRVLRATTILFVGGELLVYLLLIAAWRQWWPAEQIERVLVQMLVVVGLGCLPVGVGSVVVGFARAARERPGGPVLIFLGLVAIVVGLCGFVFGGMSQI